MYTDIEMQDISKSALSMRWIAVDALQAVLKRKQMLDIFFSQHKGYLNLPKRDRAFVRMLVMTALQHLGEIDAVLAARLDRKLHKLDPKDILNILRIGAAQVLFMNTQDHAAVDTTVELAKKMRMKKQSGMVNAILRKLIKQRGDILLEECQSKQNIPSWLWDIWCADHGEDIALDIADAIQNVAPIDITVKSDPETWAEKLDAEILPNGALRLGETAHIPELPGYDEGAWWVQNMAASIPVSLLGDLTGKRVLDACAAPGGKTAQLVNAGAHVVALDRSKKRLERLDENMQRLDMTASVDVVCADAATYEPDELFDVVLLDVPCTATGTVRSQPEVMHLRQPQDLEKLQQTQQRLLAHAASLLKPDGVLIYCTCSMQKAEGEGVIQHVLTEDPSLFRIDAITENEIFENCNFIDNQGFVRVFPFNLQENGGLDGFFVARLIRC